MGGRGGGGTSVEGGGGTVTLYHHTSAEAAHSIVRDGFKPTHKHGEADWYVRETSKYGYFSRNKTAQSGYGSHTVSVRVPRRYVERDPWSGHIRVKVNHLPKNGFRIYEDRS